MILEGELLRVKGDFEMYCEPDGAFYPICSKQYLHLLREKMENLIAEFASDVPTLEHPNPELIHAAALLADAKYQVDALMRSSAISRRRMPRTRFLRIECASTQLWPLDAPLTIYSSEPEERQHKCTHR